MKNVALKFDSEIVNTTSVIKCRIHNIRNFSYMKVYDIINHIRNTCFQQYNKP